MLVFQKILQNSQENTHIGVPTDLLATTILKRPKKVFSRELRFISTACLKMISPPLFLKLAFDMRKTWIAAKNMRRNSNKRHATAQLKKFYYICIFWKSNILTKLQVRNKFFSWKIMSSFRDDIFYFTPRSEISQKFIYSFLATVSAEVLRIP